MRYFIEIRPNGAGYTVDLHQGNVAVARRRSDVLLGPAATVQIKGRAYTLGELAEALARYDVRSLAAAYHVRGQLEIGQYLYGQLFGDLEPARLAGQDAAVELRLVSAEEHITSLPWPLLAHQGVFLATSGWTTSLARDAPLRNCALPRHPRLLVVAPEPAGQPRTGATEHVEQLERQLARFDRHLSRGDNLKVVTTWEDLSGCLEEFTPHVVYYYGHGSGDQHASALLFADGQQRTLARPATDLALALRRPASPPLLAYINCCSGASGGLLGAGWQIGQVVPAVITNRTIAHADAARAQALVLLPAMLGEGLPPHLALAQLSLRLEQLDLSFDDARWIAPVLYSQYSSWSGAERPRHDPLYHDAHWDLKLDRVRQFGTVAFQTRQMIRERRPQALAYVWYGRKGQGIEIFHERLKVELREDLPAQTQLYEVQPEWPAEYSNERRSFEDMLCEAFAVPALRDIPPKIRAVSRSASGRPVLVYVRHQPVRSPEVLDPPRLKAYLKWWDSAFTPLLGEHQHALLGISFEVQKDPLAFRRIIREEERIHELDLASTNFRLLDELERLTEEDVIDNVQLPPRLRERVVQEILGQTEGHYELTIRALRALIERTTDAPEDEEPRPADGKRRYDY
jgi:hypothetical protein